MRELVGVDIISPGVKCKCLKDINLVVLGELLLLVLWQVDGALQPPLLWAFGKLVGKV